MFGRKTAIEKRLDAAKADLVAARARAAAVASGQDEAAADAAAYASWRTEQEAADGEVERLDRLIGALQSGAEAARIHDAEETLRKRAAAARKLNAELAAKMKTDGVIMVSELIKFIVAISAAEVETNSINKILPDGEAYVISANLLARGMLAVPREVIDERNVKLWAFASTGEVVGNQEAVVPNKNNPDTGSLDAGAGVLGVACVRREFRSVQVHPYEPAQLVEHIHSAARIPSFTGPELAFDGALLPVEYAAAFDADAPKRTQPAPRKRRIETELTPMGPMPEFKSATQIEHERLQREHT